jgi:hypothetical protein
VPSKLPSKLLDKLRVIAIAFLSGIYTYRYRFVYTITVKQNTDIKRQQLFFVVLLFGIVLLLIKGQ